MNKKNNDDFKSLGTALREADRLVNEDMDEEACKLLEPYLDEFPDNPVLLDMLAHCYSYIAEYDKAIHLERSLLEIRMSLEARYETLSFMCRLFKLSDKYDEALKIANIMIIQYPNNPHSHLEALNCYFTLRDAENAQLHVLVIEKIMGNNRKYTEDIKLLTGLAMFYNDQGEYERSIIILKKALEIYPTDENLLGYIADAYFYTDNFIEARKYYQLIIDNHPEHWQLGYVFEQIKKCDGYF